MKIKILYICPSSGLGGAETFLKNTFIDHKSTEFSPVYLVFRKGPLVTWLKDNGAEVVVLPRAPRLSRPISVLKTHNFIKNLIKQKNITIVHSTMAYGALFSSLAAKQCHVIHLWFQHGPASGWMDQLAALLPHHAILVNSEYTKKIQIHLEKAFKFFIRKNRIIKKITLGTQPFLPTNKANAQALRENLIQRFQLAENVTLFAMACRLQKWKGVDLVIEAARIRWLTDKNFFVCIWGDIFDSADYLSEIKKKSVELPISFEGPCSDVSLAFSACDVVINASLQPEPFGLTLIEAFSAGKTVIGPNEGGPMEIVEDDKTGLLFQTRNPESLSEKMGKLTLNKEKLSFLKKNASEIFLQKYTSQKMMIELENFYRFLVNTVQK